MHPGPIDGPIADFVKPTIAMQRYSRGEDSAGPQASFVIGAESMADGSFTA